MMGQEQDIRVGIYGGTFAPVHNGHINAAKLFMEQMRLDYLFVIPAAIPPHKQVDVSDDPTHRLNMCAIAFGDMDGVVVSDMEIKRGGKSYTVETLRELSGEDRRLFFLCGTDMMLTLDRWREPEEIFRLCYPVYMRRENDPIIEGQLIAKNKEYLARFGKIARRVPCDFVDISSTEIRRMVKAGEDITGVVSPRVAAYVKEHGLYV